jgi:hypothetical protein
VSSALLTDIETAWPSAALAGIIINRRVSTRFRACKAIRIEVFRVSEASSA